jgi:hypothetical protein
LVRGSQLAHPHKGAHNLDLDRHGVRRGAPTTTANARRV